jgi:hypothetical protein
MRRDLTINLTNGAVLVGMEERKKIGRENLLLVRLGDKLVV